MDRDMTVQKLAQARQLLREIAETNESPLIARCLRLADYNLHWALWQLGEFETLMPELEEGVEQPV